MRPIRALKNYNEGGKGTREMEKQKWQQVAKQLCPTSDSLLQSCSHPPQQGTDTQTPSQPAPGSLGLAQPEGIHPGKHLALCGIILQLFVTPGAVP